MKWAGGPSLTRHLLAWALGALTLVWATFIGFGYKTGEHEADELTDGHLASVSSLLLPLAPGGMGRGVVPRDPAVAAQNLKAHDYQRSLSVVVWDAGGTVVSRTGDAPLPPFASPDGFASLQLGDPPQLWRAFSRWDEQHRYRLMVLLSQRERDALAADIAGQVIEPGLWLLPVVALVLGLAIHRGLRPLRRLAEQVHALDPNDTRKVEDPVRFQELAAAVDAINRLVDRYHAVLTRERALASEFAHELRTPLASLALQARGAREAPPGALQQEALGRLEEDALRAGDVLAHLLALARASRAELHESAQPVDLDTVARRVVAEFAPHAHAGGRELGLSSPGPFPLSGHPVLLELALRNLVQNALAHTPRGTQVEVELDPATRALQVADDGQQHGGPPGEAAPPLQPLRLGLGHRVVEKVAALHGATFEPEVALPDARRAWRIRFSPPAGAGP
ncbi:histidine kinase dimerization/phospho-acceptor domain-containing protein [Ramlibacter alkalitolerans]|uniref:histidine kinase n=1 Tax=Ramlibacter alkalitolerans TaxID=2039631 RepID=A0ABS1JW63_9BURK|nr:histidine kinase dimerization/phospho-acceptor domain-containing protein [Ramlibacter alkalitolerans]MBL0428376.1 sensor histidine kinase N-terminal domain-containing protein [Ramlibacter alkalitolerans]